MWPKSESALVAIVVYLALALAHTNPAMSQSPEQLAQAREQMVVDRIESAGVKDARVLRSMRETPRHEFVPTSQRSRAYLDMALPIGNSQTISSPFIVAWMTEALQPQPSDKVLEIGTGSGYQAAVLSPLVQDVYTIEIVKPLGDRAALVLKNLGYENVHVRTGDGFAGWPEEAPFDKIIVTCSPESVPQPLVDQLREGGRMIIPVGERYQQTLYLMIKKDGQLERRPLQPTLFVPMTGEAEATRKQQPDAANPSVVNGDFESSLVDESSDLVPKEIDTVKGWYYGRQVREMTGDAFEGNGFVRFENKTPELASHLLQGIPIDGQQVTTIRLSAAVKLNNVKAGTLGDSLPSIAISLYDEQRRDVGMFVIGPFSGTKGWGKHSRLIRIPPQTREAIVRIGLFGATGTADFDAVKIEPIR